VAETLERPVAKPVRHGLDTFALTIGLLCLALAVLTLLSRGDLVEVDGVVVLATVWVVLGVVGVSRSLFRLLRGPQERG
jgi:hypothetical protein